MLARFTFIKKAAIAFAALLSFVIFYSVSAFADEDLLNCNVETITTVKNNLISTLPSTPINMVECTPINGFYQVKAGKNFFYTDKEASYLFVGGFYSIKHGDITGPVLRTTNSEPSLPKANKTFRAAPKPKIVSAKGLPETPINLGSGEKVVYLFSDPNCSFCLRAHLGLKKILENGLDVTIKELPFGLLEGAGSVKHASAIWCSDDVKAALENHYAGYAQTSDCPEGTAIQEKIKEEFIDRGFGGTPVFLSESGEVFEGWPQNAHTAFPEWVESLGNSSGKVAEAKISWSDLPETPLQHGDIGGEKVALITHPNCKHCRSLHKNLKKLSGYEFHEYLAASDVDPMLQGIYCDKEPVAKLQQAMSGSRFTVQVQEGCGVSVQEKTIQFLKSNNLKGTPLIVRSDGAIKRGFKSLSSLKAWLQDAPNSADGKKLVSNSTQEVGE